MDKNSVIGLILIFLIFIGWYQFSKPTKEQIEAQQRYNDSIAMVQQSLDAQAKSVTKANPTNDSLVSDSSKSLIQNTYGDFGVSAFKKAEFYTLENELAKITISNKGGRISCVELKKYKTHDGKPLIIFDGDESNFGFTLLTKNNRVVNSSDLYFDAVAPVSKDTHGNQTITLRLKTSSDAFMDFKYTLPANDYMLSYSIQSSNMNNVMPQGTKSLEMQWIAKIRQQEKGRKFEARYSQLNYKFTAGDCEKLSESKDDKKDLTTKVQWIAFKDQFFSSIIIADQSFTSTRVASTVENDSFKYLKTYSANTSVGFDPTGKVPTTFKLYFGPNQYKILSAYDKGKTEDTNYQLNRLIPLGWGLFGWVNRFAIIPMFNFFNGFISNFGLIILLMTIVIKLVLFPLTFSSLKSAAKMRVLKPELDEIHARIPADKAMERQKAQMDLYGKVGVSPLSGCIPSVLQMPILFAMFSFFPASIELRQQTFLWATDLSAYDSILSWKANIPLISWAFDNHISLFTLLMTATSILFTHLNMQTTSASTEQMPGMKWMMYLMPVVFMFMFNSYASGLSYYYFIATLISILQTYAIRATIDEKKLLAQLHEKRKSNEAKGKKKSSFMERLEQMQREQQKALSNNSTKNKKK
jgi:YidC/Oxa1 family membrane protein insertase